MPIEALESSARPKKNGSLRVGKDWVIAPVVVLQALIDFFDPDGPEATSCCIKLEAMY